MAWWVKAKFCSRSCRSDYPIFTETKKRMSLSKIGNTNSLGYRHTVQARLNMSRAQVGRKCYWEGKKFSSKHRAKVVAGLLKNPYRFPKGVKPWNWKEDRSLIKLGDRNFHDPLYKQWHMAIKNRDGWKCRISNGDCSGKLEAHHILPWSKFLALRYEVNNGIALCHFHHPRKREDEMKLSPFFQSLVAPKD